mmetsp:Transcript_73369/g.212341  ORF Transcript_73369/g.212341 Transcript_73369/m.212341 type:complete len:311 (-) Transcript_73369:438-1370(-)
MRKYTDVKTNDWTMMSKLFTLNLAKKYAGTEMPLALSRQNMGWSPPNTCKQKIANNNANAVCKFRSAMQLHRGVESMKASNTARTTAPSARAARKSARCVFIRHHCTKRRSARMRHCSKWPGVSRFNPLNGSNGAVTIERILGCAAANPAGNWPLSPNSGSTPSTPTSLSLSVKEDELLLNPIMRSLEFASRATSPRRLQRYSVNCFLVTLLASVPAMRSMSSETTSASGLTFEQFASNLCNSSLLTTPSPLVSILCHSSDNVCARIARSSLSFTSRPPSVVKVGWRLRQSDTRFSHMSKSMSGLKSGIS